MAARGGSSSNLSSLRDRQIVSLRAIFSNKDSADQNENDQHQGNGFLTSTAPILDAEGVPIWKILCFDDLGRDVISSVLRVSDLRAMGVSLHMHISGTRNQISDVPVVYLVEPTPENLQSITSDLQNGLYSPAYINFLSSIPRLLLEDFAAQTATAGTSEHIAQIYDQYLNFICEGDNLFSLGMQKEHTYWALNSAKTTDDELERVIDRIVSGLFSVVVCMGSIPIIRAPKGAAAELVAQKLDRKLRDHVLNSKDNLFSGGRPSSSNAASTPTSRPVLIILDRNVDLTSMFSHAWTYWSLIQDILEFKLNRVTLETPVDESNPAKSAKKVAYDITGSDFFFGRNWALPFPQVAEDIDNELTKYRDETAAITKRTGVSSLDDLTGDDTSAQAEHLKAAITVLPELRERKAVLDSHMNILAALLPGIKDRALDTYFELEEGIAKQTKAQVLQLLKDTKGTDAVDKLRLFLIWYLSSDHDVSRPEWQEFESTLTESGVDPACLPYIKQVRGVTKMTSLATTTSTAQPAQGSDLFGRFSSISSRLQNRLKESGVPTTALSANFDTLFSGIKSFLPANRDLAVTKIVESVMDPSNASTASIASTENYLYFDPRSSGARGAMPPPSTLRAQAPGALPNHGSAPGMGASFGQRRQGFSEAVVFTLGGGSIFEYTNLQEWATRTSGGDRAGKKVVYGSTEITSASDFIRDELERLGREVAS